MPTCCLVLLTLNEIEGSKALYKKIPLLLFDEVILVDGGSTDGTIEFWVKRHWAAADNKFFFDIGSGNQNEFEMNKTAEKLSFTIWDNVG